MVINELSEYNFKMWLQDKCSTHCGTITNVFIDGSISAQYDGKRRMFIIHPHNKEYSRAEVEHSLQSNAELDSLVAKMLRDCSNGSSSMSDFF